MFKKLLLPVFLLLLCYGFWASTNFTEISAGVVIFLFGMLALKNGFEAFSGGVLEKILKFSTSNLLKSISFGFVTTTLMQSSALVAILAISFLGAGLIELTQGIGIIYGANIGTTTGAWLMAGIGLKIKLSAYAMPMIVFGAVFMFQKSKSLKGLGYILAGIGFLFLGIHYMMDGFKYLKETIDLSSFGVSGFKGLMIFIGVGIIATIAMQSSHATIMLVIAALAVGQVSYENAIAITIGANIGTTVTAILGSLTSNVSGKRLAGAHFVFNVATAVIGVAFLSPIISFVDFLSDFLGIASDNYALRLAVFDTFFKTMGVVVMMPFTNKLVWFLQSYIKPSNAKNSPLHVENPRYINDSALELSATAYLAIIKESNHLYDNTFEIISHGLNVKRQNIISTMDLDEVISEQYRENMINIDELYKLKIKNIYSKIIEFSTKAQFNMPQSYIKNIYKIKLANRDMVEAIKDTKHLQKNLKIYLKSDNAAIKEEYNKIRKKLIKLLRDINTIATTEEEEVIVLLLARVRECKKEHDIISDGTLDHLIRNNLISNKMATSLMNDSAYARNISAKLVSMAESLFVLRHEKIMDLSDDYISEDEEQKE